MENVKEFVELRNGDGSGYGDGSCGDGSGYGSCGYGYGNGDGSGYGDGSCGDGSGYGSCGYGNGDGSGYGDGSCGDGSGYGSCGYGYGNGDGSGDGYGDGYGDGNGLRSVNGYILYNIDGIPTGIYRARGNVAKGFILNGFAMKPCYIVRDGDTFAHGDTLKEAEYALREKIMETMDEDEAIESFREHFKPGAKYKNSEFFEWHHYLTGSCRMGRKNFCSNHGVDMDGESTPEYFIELTKDAYGGETIKKLKQYYPT